MPHRHIASTAPRWTGSSCRLSWTLLAPLCIGLAGCDPFGSAQGPPEEPSIAYRWNEPVEVIETTARPTGLGLDAQSLYFCDESGFVRFVAKDGGVVTALYEDAGPTTELIVAGSTVYWLQPSYGRLQSYGLDTELPATLAVGLAEPRGLTLTTTHLYWIDGESTVLRVPRSGGYAETVLVRSSPIGDLALDSSRLYYTDVFGGTVGALPFDGSPEQTLASGQTDLAEVAADGTRIYWSTSNRIAAIDVEEPSEPMTVLAEGLPGPRGLLAAGGYLYFALPDEREVRRVPKTGGRPETIARDQRAPRHVTVDTVAVYWVTDGDDDDGKSGSLRKVVRQ